MNDYKKLVTEEARTFYASAVPEFDVDPEEHGGKSSSPNLASWIDRTGKLVERVEQLAAKWGHKDVLWVQSNTRSKNPRVGGDPRSNAFASFLQDIRHEIKKFARASAGGG